MLRILAVCVVLGLAAPVSAAETEATAKAMKAVAVTEQKNADKTRATADGQYAVAAKQVADLETLFYANYSFLEAVCAPEDWSAIQSNLYAAYNFGSAGSVSYNYGDSLCSTGNADMGTADLFFGESNWDYAHLFYDHSRSNYAAAWIIHYTDANSAYCLAEFYASAGLLIVNDYLP